jgi:hypothetical protein
MARHTLYAYVDGSDLEAVAGDIEGALKLAAASAKWALPQPRIINQRHERDDSHSPGDLTDWDLGLNLLLPTQDAEPVDWFHDIEEVIRIVHQVARTTGREFVIGIQDADSGIAEDLLFVGSGPPIDLTPLRAFMGIGPRG